MRILCTTCTFLVVLIELLAVRSYAQTHPFTLVVFPDASVSIKNVSDNIWTVDGYIINSGSGLLTVDAWMSVEDQFKNDPEAIRSLLGNDFPKPGLPFGEFAESNAMALGELLPLPPWPPSAMISIGKPLGADLESARSLVSSDNFSWYIELGPEFGPFPVVFVPEPATIVLLLCASPVFLMLVRRRRRCP